MSAVPRDFLAVVGGVARHLNAGGSADATLSGVAESLRAALAATEVALWVHDPATASFRRIDAPRSGRTLERVRTLDAIPEAPPGAARVPLVHAGTRYGYLDVTVAEAEREIPLLRVIADTLSPFVASSELARHLAYQVAARSREIEEQRLFTSLIIDCLPVGLYVIDRDYRIQVWNRKRETGTQGLRRDEVVGKPIFDVLTRQPAEQLRQEFDRVFETGEIQQVELEVRLEHDTRYYRTTKIPMRLDGDDISHVITIGEDVTDWRAFQRQITQNEKLAAIGQLAAGVMHEINNPLATIGACVAALDGRMGQPDEAVAREYLDIIEKEVQRCTNIVAGLLDFSRPKGKAKEAVSVNRIVNDALFLFKHHQRFREITVETQFDPMLPSVLANPEQMIQVLMALLLNALDAMERGGIITLRTARSRTRQGNVQIEVSDTGTGIPSSQQTKIFEPFYTTKPPGRGTGLGLSICYGIVAEHRGRLEVESQPGLGSTFRISLPVADGVA